MITARLSRSRTRRSDTAVVSRRSAPPLDRLEAALAAYTSEITALRNEGLTRTLSSIDAERVFALGFAIEQLHQNLSDLARCVQEWAQRASAGKGGQAGTEG